MSSPNKDQIFTADEVAGMVNHMNEDHADSVLLYVQAYTDFEGAETARMLSVDAAGMDLLALKEGSETPIRIPFEKRLKTPKDAHMTLVSMSKRARR